MRELVLVCLTCVIGWGLAQGFTSAREIKEIQRQDREDMIWLTPEHYFK